MKNLLLIALCVGSLAVVPGCWRKKRVVVETPNGEFVLDTPDKKTEKSHRVVKIHHERSI